MFTHEQIWTAIDKLAEKNGLSPSGLARRAGLDPTTFNKSKRFAKDGRARWPSTESIAKILTVTRSNYANFYGYGSTAGAATQNGHDRKSILPIMGFAQAGVGGFFDDGGFPVGHGWEEVDLPTVSDQGDYALRISGDSMLPVYRDGDIIVVSAGKQPIPGDRVVVRTIDGEVMAKVLVAETEKDLTFMSFNQDHPNRKLNREAVEWLVRITWASQ